MRPLIFFNLLFIFVINIPSFSQTANNVGNVKNDTTIYSIVDKQAQYPGGDKEALQFIGQHMKYPQEALRTNTQGKVYMKFVIEKDGTINSSTIIIMTGIGHGCDDECLRIIKTLPKKWVSAILGGQSVRSYYVLPIAFLLE